MPGPLPLRGVRGTIRWYYMVAAGVTDFVVVYDRDRYAWTLRGGLVAPDPYKLGEAPLEFVAPTKGGGALRWPVLSLAIANGRVSALLGSPIGATNHHESFRPT